MHFMVVSFVTLHLLHQEMVLHNASKRFIWPSLPNAALILEQGNGEHTVRIQETGRDQGRQQ